MFEMKVKPYRMPSTISLLFVLASLLEPGLGFSINEECPFKARRTTTSPLRLGEASILAPTTPTACVTYIVSTYAYSRISSLLHGSNKDDEHVSSPASNDQLKDDIQICKAQSPLAMAAQDWLDEEEDELSSYWNRFDENKSDAKKAAKSKVFEIPDVPVVDRSLSTDQLLDQYYEGRGIDKRIENKHRDEIQQALNAAKKAKSAKEAVRILEGVRPWLQTNTKLGGDALLELGEAHEADGNIIEAKTIFDSLQSNQQNSIKKKARYLFSESSRAPKKYGDDIWNMFKMW